MNTGYVTLVLLETIKFPAYSDEIDKVDLSG
jgi:hypothetical protein